METGEYFLISIHALLAESDAVDVTQRLPVVGISIHALLAESDRKRLRIRAKTR